MDVKQYIKDCKLKILVKPNSKENEVLGYDESRQAIKVAIKAKPEDNKANIEVMRFFKRLLKRDVKIIVGLRSREKILKIY